MNRDRPTTLSRRAILRAAAATAAGVAGCTPLRFLFSSAPVGFERDPTRLNVVLRAFAAAVMPGIPEDDRNLVRALHDPFYPLARYRTLLASELCRVAAQTAGTERFETLSGTQRTRVIQAALDEGGLVQRLVQGAIHLTQISNYAGIYDDQNGCPLIDFGGRHGVQSIRLASYEHGPRFEPRSLTGNGNPA